jgi:hypothetical protein
LAELSGGITVHRPVDALCRLHLTDIAIAVRTVEEILCMGHRRGRHDGEDITVAGLAGVRHVAGVGNMTANHLEEIVVVITTISSAWQWPSREASLFRLLDIWVWDFDDLVADISTAEANRFELQCEA